MPVITLPDGSKRRFDTAVTVQDIAETIGQGLASAALAGEVDGRLVDLSYRINGDVRLRIITATDPEGLAVLRHSTAHLLAYAVKALFPDAQVTIGPVIEDGFYYDFSYQRPFTLDDLPAIEAKMHALAEKDEPTLRLEWSRKEAIDYFAQKGEHYKVKIIESIPEGEVLSLYRQGDFIDLCRGPHLPSTGKIKVFKLLKVAGAYWRGDARGEMLQRIYGTAWATKKELDAYLYRVEEAQRRDHRKIGKEQHLFHMQDEAPGMVFWHPNGWTLWQTVEQDIRSQLRNAGYLEVRTPQVIVRDLWEKSGHWEHYGEHMFTLESEKRVYAIKPMNCPGHVQIFNHSLHSYRDLPLRLSEFGACHRNEPSGALHGLMRVRAFTQDDAHIFCTEEQITSETIAFHTLAMNLYRRFGFTEVAVKLALRPEKRADRDAVWDQAEAGLRQALTACGIAWVELAGEGAFYGPKIEYHIKDAIGRSWQCGTLQLDFVLPARLGAQYVAENNERRCPVMLHRAIVGSMERFLGIVLENVAGKLPVWLAPVQIVVMSISDMYGVYAQDVALQFKAAGLRVTLDLRNEKIDRKIRDHALQSVPYLLVVGKKEAADNTVSVRCRGQNQSTTMTVDALIQTIKATFPDS